MRGYERWSRPTGRMRVRAQPITCFELVTAIKYLGEKGGYGFKDEIKLHLRKKGFPPSTANTSIFIELSKYGFVKEEKKLKRFQLVDWAFETIAQCKQKDDILIGLAMGILSYKGTQLILLGLKKLQEKGEKVTLERLFEIIETKERVPLYLITKLLDAPSERDSYALAILSSYGKSSKPKQFNIRLHEDRLRAYQISIASRYLEEAIPETIQSKYGLPFDVAIKNNLNLLSAEALREALKDKPSVWLSDDNLDSILKEITENYYEYDWWAEDRVGVGRGLLDNQHYAYVKITKKPLRIPLKNLFHGLF